MARAPKSTEKTEPAMCRKELQSGRWQVETAKWQTANGNRRYAVAHIIIALIYGSIFAANYFAPARPKTKKKRNPKRKSHGMCLFPCPCHCCRPRADSMPSPGLRASEITFITDKGGPSCSCYRRAKARHLQLSIQCNLLLCSRT